MSDQIQGALVHEMLGRFIEEAVERAVGAQMDKLAERAEKRTEDAIAVGAAKMAEILTRSSEEAENGFTG